MITSSGYPCLTGCATDLAVAHFGRTFFATGQASPDVRSQAHVELQRMADNGVILLEALCGRQMLD